MSAKKELQKISVIVPLYNEEKVINETFFRLQRVLGSSDMDFEIIFIDDGSCDNTLTLVKKIADQYAYIRYRSFSRNFGHQNALSAGIDIASGDCTVFIDADLQDPPELILEMIKKWREGYQVVYAQRSERKGETLFKKITASWFYILLEKLSEFDIPRDTGDFRLIDRKVVEAMRMMPEKNKYLRGMVAWSGFKQTGIPYIRHERYAGTTKYSLKKMIRFGLSGIIAFSSYPLILTVIMGFAITMLSILIASYVLYLKLFTYQTISGWTSLILVMLFLGGVNILCIGIIGIYISSIVANVKNRPDYIIKEEN